MRLERHMTKYYFVDSETKEKYVVCFIDFEKKEDGYSVVIQKGVRVTFGRGEYIPFDTLDTMQSPTLQLAKTLLIRSINAANKQKADRNNLLQ